MTTLDFSTLCTVYEAECEKCTLSLHTAGKVEFRLLCHNGEFSEYTHYQELKTKKEHHLFMNVHSASLVLSSVTAPHRF